MVTLSVETVTRFREDGAAVLRGVFAPWVETLAAGVARNMAEPGPFAHDYLDEAGEGDAGGRFFGDYCNWERIPEYRDFVLHSPAGEVAAAVMGSGRAQFFHEHVLVKEPGTGKETPWHHDLPYYCVDGDQTVSMWIALDPVERAVCPRFVAGSHRWGKLFYPRKFVDMSQYEYESSDYAPVPDIDGAAESYRILSWDMAPGDAVLFSYRTLHGAPGNRSGHRRRAFSARWVGDDVVFAERPGRTSPPYPGIGLKPGEPLREDWFPVVWPSLDRPRDGC